MSTSTDGVPTPGRYGCTDTDIGFVLDSGDPLLTRIKGGEFQQAFQGAKVGTNKSQLSTPPRCLLAASPRIRTDQNLVLRTVYSGCAIVSHIYNRYTKYPVRNAL